MSQTSPRVIVIGSGAGGAVTALVLAEAGLSVTVLEEGARLTLDDYGKPPTDAIGRMYRRRGMNPIMGRTPIAYAEGCCVGGSTEINSGFWHRAPREILMRWKAQFDLADAAEADLEPHYRWAEQLLGVGPFRGTWPASTALFARGITAMGWSYQEVPRVAPGCANTNTCAQGCPTGAKQGMTARVLPMAERAGARIVSGCRAEWLLVRRGRVEGVRVRRRSPDGPETIEDLAADHVFVCGGPTETPALLRRSGIRHKVGNSLRIHPYLKVVARFPQIVDADRSVLPLLQVKEFWPEISMGGAYLTPGHLAVMLSENRESLARMRDGRHMAAYYVGVKGTGTGSIRPSLIGASGTSIRYDLSDEDTLNLSRGLARLSSLLLAGGAEAVFPSVYGVPAIRSEQEAIRWLDERLPRSGLALMTVHAFSSCPIGERRDRCAADSFGKVFGSEGLYLNDASTLPDSPGVNPQGTVMAIARRNALAFAGGPRPVAPASGAVS
jgi:choline dehydrogenase-like flavoprotein